MTTTGLPKVTAGLDEAVVAATRSAGFVLLPFAAIGADLAAAGIAIAAVAAIDGSWTPSALVSLLVLWPSLTALSGERSIGGHRVVRPRELGRAACLAVVIAWSALAVAPDMGPGSAADAARSLALLVMLLPALSISLRTVSDRLVAAAPQRVVLVGDVHGIEHLVSGAQLTAGGGQRSLLPVAIHVRGSEPLDNSGFPADLTIWRDDVELLDVVRSHSATAVVVAPDIGLDQHQMRRWGAMLEQEGARLMVSSGFRDVATRRLGLSQLGALSLLDVRPSELHGTAHLLKGVADRMAAALLLVLVTPLLLCLALQIRCGSRGPALYKQTRIGRHGRPFTVYKLRTMCQDAHASVQELSSRNESDAVGILFKIRCDPRVTPIGAVLRKFSLDELPQLINVVRGEMSLIGPRPALPEEVSAYAPELHRRLDVRPGMTGLWQVSGRSDLSWEETVRLDLSYVDNWCWALDARISMRTVGAVLQHRGAY